MNSILIFYGPKKEFLTKIPNGDIKNFTEVVSLEDAERRNYQLNIPNQEREVREKIKIENLIVYTDEYSSVQEHVIVNFVNFLNTFEINNLFLQNPPIVIQKEVEKVYSSILKIEYFKYNFLSVPNLREIFEKYSSVVIGQEESITKLIHSLYPMTRNKKNLPITLLFYGPSGVGKTETAKYLSTVLKENLFRKQLSMFQNNEFSTYLFGGKYSQSSFARDLLERESNVILLDEFDKANPIFHSAFYQIFDEGVFVDSNYNVDVNNAIIICTCNYMTEKEIKKKLGEPIYYRFDSIIEFKSFNVESLEKILLREIERQLELLSQKELEIIIKDEIIALLMPNANRFSNARQVRKIVKDYISKLLFEKLILK